MYFSTFNVFAFFSCEPVILFTKFTLQLGDNLSSQYLPINRIKCFVLTRLSSLFYPSIFFIFPLSNNFSYSFIPITVNPEPESNSNKILLLLSHKYRYSGTVELISFWILLHESFDTKDSQIDSMLPPFPKALHILLMWPSFPHAKHLIFLFIILLGCF